MRAAGCAICGPPGPHRTAAQMEEIKTGSCIVFGDYTWRVLNKRDGSALILTESIIDQRPYHDAYAAITWADCTLRAYLNGEFLRTFSAAERERILPVTIQNPDNHWYGTKGGADTRDRVFLLSLEEAACRYFGDSSDKLYHPGKNQRYWFQRKDPNNGLRLAKLQNGQRWWWWLRSPGRVGVKAVYIHGTDGNIGIQGNNVLIGNLSDGRCTGGVRPALWLKI